ncbi:MAG: SpoIVB peptidase [Christensenellales bacterium]|jgi:stage IV sporulation protein B
MRKNIKHGPWARISGWVLAGLILIGGNLPWVRQVAALPDQIVLSHGQTGTYQWNLPAGVTLPEEQMVASLWGNTLSEVAVSRQRVQLSLLGIPLKQVEVVVKPDRMLLPGGQSVGVTLYTQGALVVGTSQVNPNQAGSRDPAAEAGILPGDVIEQVGDTPVDNAAHLSELTDGLAGQSVRLTLQRDGKQKQVEVVPEQDKLDGVWRLGLWVRDSTAGVGTMTYVDPQRMVYGALGHGITDADTGSYLEVKSGAILKSQVVEITQGQKGHPGELKGQLSMDQVWGDVDENTQVGVFGHCPERMTNEVFPGELPIALRSSVEIGDAQILTTIDDTGVRLFSCRVVKVQPQSRSAAKSMVIEVTDPELLEKTGGIVQGMSGSPIIQNGHIIGAVTHVFVGDPTRGYGVYIEWMLEQSDQLAS